MVGQPAGQDDTVRGGVFVHRVAPPKLSAELGELLLLFLLLWLFVGSWLLGLLVVKLNWPITPSAVIVSALVLIAPALELRHSYRWHHTNVDREGISLLVDEAGVYAGGRHPLRIGWPAVAEVDLSWQHPPNHPETSASGSTDPWPELTVTARSGWRRSWALDADDLKTIRALVGQHAPDVRVTGNFFRDPGR
jgi:hypothetical protein